MNMASSGDVLTRCCGVPHHSLTPMNIVELAVAFAMCIGKWLQAKSERAQLQAQLQAKVQAELQAELQEYKYMRKLLQQLLFWLDILSSVSSGFRNLLLDGRWLEFWEIILLAAGDVERNPGPTEEQWVAVSSALIGESDLHRVFKEVHTVSSKWRQLCRCLGISPSQIEYINSTQQGNCGLYLNEGLKEWLRRNYDTEEHGLPTWRKLVAAVGDPTGGNDYARAQTIAKNHNANKRTNAQRVMKPVEDDCSREESRHGHQQSAAFSKMYGAITRGIGRNLDVDDLRQFLRYFSHPRSSNQRYIQPSLYIGVERFWISCTPSTSIQRISISWRRSSRSPTLVSARDFWTSISGSIHTDKTVHVT